MEADTRPSTGAARSTVGAVVAGAGLDSNSRTRRGGGGRGRGGRKGRGGSEGQREGGGRHLMTEVWGFKSFFCEGTPQPVLFCCRTLPRCVWRNEGTRLCLRLGLKGLSHLVVFFFVGRGPTSPRKKQWPLSGSQPSTSFYPSSASPAVTGLERTPRPAATAAAATGAVPGGTVWPVDRRGPIKFFPPRSRHPPKVGPQGISGAQRASDQKIELYG